VQKLPVSLVIALWLVSSLWLVGLVFYFFGMPAELLGAVFILGLVTALLEWLASSRRK
jgi:hypothetical protein